MARTARHSSEGVLYHLIARGCARQTIFRDEQDHLAFESMLVRLLGETATTILAYCLMANHIHLVARSEAGSISTFMHRLLLCYALRFNRKYERAGHVFQNRFFSRTCLTERYLLALVRYVHLNPVKAGVVSKASSWRWSSHREYLLGSGRISRPALVLQMVGGPGDFSRFVDGYDLSLLPPPGELLAEETSVSTTGVPGLDVLSTEITARTGIPLGDLRSGCKRADVVAARRALVREGLGQGHTATALARFLGVGPSTIGMIQRRIREEAR